MKISSSGITYQVLYELKNEKKLPKVFLDILKRHTDTPTPLNDTNLMQLLAHVKTPFLQQELAKRLSLAQINSASKKLPPSKFNEWLSRSDISVQAAWQCIKAATIAPTTIRHEELDNIKSVESTEVLYAYLAEHPHLSTDIKAGIQSLLDTALNPASRQSTIILTSPEHLDTPLTCSKAQLHAKFLQAIGRYDYKESKKNHGSLSIEVSNECFNQISDLEDFYSFSHFIDETNVYDLLASADFLADDDALNFIQHYIIDTPDQFTEFHSHLNILHTSNSAKSISNALKYLESCLAQFSDKKILYRYLMEQVVSIAITRHNVKPFCSFLLTLMREYPQAHSELREKLAWNIIYADAFWSGRSPFDEPKNSDKKQILGQNEKVLTNYRAIWYMHHPAEAEQVRGRFAGLTSLFRRINN